ncbi:MAG: helix-turn-helix domain-containing protein [Saprospiraceae bacterium]
MMYLLSGFGIFFSALLLGYNKGYKSARIYLGLYLFLFNFIILSHYFYLYNESRVTIAFILSIPFNASAFAIGPLAFLYVRSILKDEVHFTKNDWLHFILFAIIFLGRITYNLSSWDDKLLLADKIINGSWRSLSNSSLNHFLPLRIIYNLKILHFLIYLIAIWYILLKSRVKRTSSLALLKQQKIVYDWLYFFAVTVSILGVLLGIILFPNAKDKLTYQHDANILFMLVFSGFLILILGLILYPQILYGIPIEKTLVKINDEVSESKVIDETESIFFHDDYIENISVLIQKWVEEFKFKNPNSTMKCLSEDIDIPKHHLAYFFNQIKKEKYIDWRNKLRVEYAIEILGRVHKYDKTIEVLGAESGFRSYSAFIRSFKQFTGKLPKDFIREINA